MNLGFVLNYWGGWQGGRVFISQIIETLIQGVDHGVRVMLLLRVDADVLGGSEVASVKAHQLDGWPFRSIAETSGDGTVFLFNDYARCRELLGLQFMGFCGGLPPDCANRWWVGYIPDFQHAYLPENFGETEKCNRDVLFRQTLDRSVAVMVNSIQVYSDVLRFFPKLSVPSRLWLLPKLLPRLQYDATEVLTRLGLTPRGYFIVCSQSWPHKRHDLVIEAFARYHDFGGEIAMLVCTGSRTAYNWLESERSINALVAKLGVSDRVVFTGELNSHDYLTLLSRAACLVQASEVEGGCGAGGVLEAGVLGTPVILSDTIVNRELWFGHCSFFVSGSAQSLAQKMKDFTISQQQRRDPLSEKQIASVADNFCTRVSLFLRQISDC